MNDRLSLPTISGLAINPASWLAKRYLETKDWEPCRKEAMENNLMKIEKNASAARYLAYTMKLLRSLDDRELQLLSSLSWHANMLWLAVSNLTNARNSSWTTVSVSGHTTAVTT